MACSWLKLISLSILTSLNNFTRYCVRVLLLGKVGTFLCTTVKALYCAQQANFEIDTIVRNFKICLNAITPQTSGPGPSGLTATFSNRSGMDDDIFALSDSEKHSTRAPSMPVQNSGTSDGSNVLKRKAFRSTETSAPASTSKKLRSYGMWCLQAEGTIARGVAALRPYRDLQTLLLATSTVTKQ